MPFSLIQDLPAYAIGTIARSRITRDDYDTILLPALEEAATDWKGINFLFVMETSFSNFSVGSWFADIKTNTRFFLKWNKLAMVSDKNSLDRLTQLFSIIASGETKTFGAQELEDAKKWIAIP